MGMLAASAAATRRSGLPGRSRALPLQYRVRLETVDAVVVKDLQKAYGATRAVAGVSFTVSFGEIFSLLGPNGAGTVPRSPLSR